MLWTVKLNNLLGKLWLPLLYVGMPKNGNYVIAKNQDVTIFLRKNSTDKLIFNEIWKEKIYLDNNLTIGPKDTVVDIGAQIGIFTLLAASLSKKGKIYALEPYQKNFNLLLKNVNANHFGNIYPLELGVWSKSGTQDLFISDLNSGAHSFYETELPNKVRIKTTTLKDLVKKVGYINFLKIDVEGSEYEIILNTPEFVFKKIGKIVVEYHEYFGSQFQHKEIVSFLRKIGYVVELEGSFVARSVLKRGIIKAYKNLVHPEA